MKKLLDRIAYRLGYMPRSLVPNIEINWEQGRPPHVRIDYGSGHWRQRVSGYVFPMLDVSGRGVELGSLVATPNPIFTEADPT